VIRSDTRPPAALGPLLDVAREGPTADEMARLAASLGPVLDAPPRARFGRGHKGALGALAIAAVGAALFATRPEDRPAPRPPAPPPIASVPEPEATPVAIAMPSAEAPVETGPALRPAPRLRRAVARPVPTPEPIAAPPPPVVTEPALAAAAPVVETPPPPAAPSDPAESLSEIALLRRAANLVSADPIHALVFVRVHEERFRGGVLAQEREVIAIDALARLGRTDAAHSRAARFAARWPGSAQRRRVEAILAR
jgi:hypothetical protein